MTKTVNDFPTIEEYKEYLKNTLLIKDSKFEMRGNLIEKDLKFIKYWQDHKIYNKLSSRNAVEYILHDGPPYANGALHSGHALNKILKDIIIRQKAIAGYKINWKIGWDTHGLPIELAVQKKDIKISEVGIHKYIEECHNYAKQQIEIQKQQFKSFGLLTDFENYYATFDNDLINKEIKIFHSMLNQNYVYRDVKPVHWSWSSKTALAEAEIEYQDLEAQSIYVLFKHESEDINFMIYTTTPWTLAANTGLAFSKDINYSLVSINSKKVVVAKELICNLEQKFNSKLEIIQDSFDISKLVNTYAFNPVNSNKSKLVFGHHVTLEIGTGIVHIAGGHGVDDYLISKQNGLEIIIAMDDNGHLINWGDLNGVFYIKAEEQILNMLKDNLVFSEKIRHQAGVDWRTKKPVVFRATKQWFFSISKIKDSLLDSIKKVSWYPKWGEERISKMIADREDWCISRQRVWGVPIPIIYDENDNPIVDKELQQNIETLFLQKGILGWIDVDIKDLLPSHIQFKSEYKKEMDILDVWYDSGSSHYVVLGNKPADLYLEGTDQYRGWFNSSLITSQVINSRAPYKKVITHGFVLDEKGQKMSKSLGNVIDPNTIVSKFGSDILKLWVASSDYTDNIAMSQNIIDQQVSDYRKIRNTIKFILSNIEDFNKKYVPTKLNQLNKLIYKNILSIANEVSELYEKFEFSKILKIIMMNLNNGSISYYLDYSKDILYIEKENSDIRRQSQFILFTILNILFYSLAPIIPVTIEEAYQVIDSSKSVFERTFKINQKINNDEWELFDKERQKINLILEQARKESKIKRSQEAEINFKLDDKLKTILSDENLAQVFLVGKFNHSQPNEINVKPLQGQKCMRCWNAVETSNMFDEHICKRCNSILK